MRKTKKKLVKSNGRNEFDLIQNLLIEKSTEKKTNTKNKQNSEMKSEREIMSLDLNE